MTSVIVANVAGQVRGEPVRLSARRRRLSTIVARHRPAAGRPFIVSVHRRPDAGEVCQPCDRTVRVRASWSRTLVGPGDTVVITLLPAGKGGLSIGLAVASIALIALAPYAAPLAAGSLLGLGGAATGTLATTIQAGMVIGGLALGMAAQASKSTDSARSRALYSVSGGGNLPRPGTRKPLRYGRCWSAPPLSQSDIVVYDGDTMVLTKRLTLGIGKFQVHRIRVGDAMFWVEGSGIQSPFNAAGGGEGRTTAIEFLFGQPSTLAPFDAAVSTSVGGQEVPRPGGNPPRSAWFRVSPAGVTVDAVQFNWTYPAIYRVSSSGRQVGTSAGIVWFIREIDKTTGNVIGPEVEFARSVELPTTFVTQPLRRSGYWRLPDGTKAYEVSAQNLYPAPLPGVEVENRVTWDGMIGFEDDTRARQETTEIVIRVRAGAGLTVTSFSDVQVEATRILPVWDGAAWTEQPTRKAVWAYCDLVRASYGLNLPDGVDAAKALYYATLLAGNDTFDGVLPEVSGFWEAASQVLHPMRADPVKVGAVHTFVRDESRAEPRHVLTRRQVVRDSGSVTFRTKREGGDVVVEFDRDGDPRRPDEVRYSYGPPSRTPKRYRVAGITDGVHALKHATWLAAVAVFRGAERKITTEWDGRLVYPGDHVLSDLWFLNTTQTYGVARLLTGTTLLLDVRATVAAEWGYGSIRTRAGREWGILRMRGAGLGRVELHPDDVVALAARSGLSLSNVLARDTQDPTTVVLGDLVELQKTYVARSAIPADADHVQIEMVADDPRVWQLLDEAVIAPAPINADGLADPLVPQISVLHAKCVRIETGIEVVWGISITRGARNYEVDLSYDAGATWEVLSPFGPASTGRAPARQSDKPLTVRARAFGRTGLPGDWVYTTFTTVAPVVDGALVDDLSLTIAKFSAQLQKEMSDINDLGLGALALGPALLDTLLNEAEALFGEGRDLTRLALTTSQDTLRGSIQQLATAIEQLAAASATEATNSYSRLERIKVQVGASFAAIERAEEARVTDREALATVRTTLGARLTKAETDLTGQATAVQSLTTKVTQYGNDITAISESITGLQSEVKTQGDAVTANSTAVSNLRTTAAQIDGRVTAQSSRMDALASTISDVSGKADANAQAVSSLKTTVDKNGTDLTALSTYATGLKSEITTINTDLGGKITANTTAISKLETRASDVDGAIKSIGEYNTGLQSQINDGYNRDLGYAGAIESLETTVTSHGGSINSMASYQEGLQSQINNNYTGQTTTAGAVSRLETRAADIEGNVSSQASSIQSLQSTVGGQSATLTTYGQSIDGIKVQFGVVGYVDGNLGGYVLTGVKNLDGSVSFDLKLKGDLFVDGSITGRMLAVQELIANSIQVKNFVLGNEKLSGGAVSSIAVATTGSGGSHCSVTVNIRRTETKVVIHAFDTGTGDTTYGRNFFPGASVLQVKRANNGQVVVSQPCSFSPDGQVVRLPPTPGYGVDYPPVGGVTYDLDRLATSTGGALLLLVMVLDV